MIQPHIGHGHDWPAISLISHLRLIEDAVFPTSSSAILGIMVDPQPKRRWWNVLAQSPGSVFLAVGILLFDVGCDGFYMCSIAICPFWFLISTVKNIIWRLGWGIAAFRILMPVLTLGIAICNGNLQWKISDANAQRVIKACDEFHVANARYPKTLNELIPTYLSVVPPAKYCLGGNFWYCSEDAHDALLWWSRYGFYRRMYNFGSRRWSNID